MQSSNLSALSIPELKAIAAQLDCTLNGDKRSKQSWIDAITIAQEIESIVEPTTEEEAEIAMSQIQCLQEILCEVIETEIHANDEESDGSDPESGDIFGGFGDDDIVAAIPDSTIGLTDLQLLAEVDINMGLSDSQMECAAVAFDFSQPKPAAAPARSKKSLNSLIVNELASHSTAAHFPLSQPKTSHTSSKKGAVTVIGALLCLLIFALTSVCTIAHTIVKYTAIIIQMFVGGYNIDYDFWYQIQLLAQQPC